MPAAEGAGRVVVVTVSDCHLCAAARAAVAVVCGSLGESWSEQDLFGLDDSAVARWRELVPVVLVDGAVVDSLWIDPQRLRRALSSG